MTKESYLNYIMLTKPKNQWAFFVYIFMMENDLVTWKEGFDFIIENCNKKTTEFMYLLTKIDHEIKRETMISFLNEGCEEGNYNPTETALVMVRELGTNPEWTKEIIENDSTDNAHKAIDRFFKEGNVPQKTMRELGIADKEC